MDVIPVAASAPREPAAAAQAPAIAPAAPQADHSTGAPQRDQGHQNAALVTAIAKMFGSPSEPQTVNLDVSYRVVHSPNEIVTVFTDPKTGIEVAQFPPEIVIALAQFFDKNSGVTLDSSV